MENFEPTEEELFNYHLKVMEPKLGRQIQIYLASHPEVAEKLQSYQKIEASFKSYPFDQPSDPVLERVRAMARQQVSSPKNIFGFLKSGLYLRPLSWALVIVLVVGLGFTLNELRDGFFVGTQEVATDVTLTDTAKTATVHSGDASEEVQTQNALNRVDDAVSGLQVSDENQKLFRDYETAIELFKNNHFKEASDMFSHIMTSKPAFEKRLELYTYWIHSLEQLGAVELANEKREEMKGF